LNPGLPGTARSLRRLVSAIALTVAALGPARALAAGDAEAPPQATAPPDKSATDLSEVVVNGIPFKETVLPTRLSSSSVYGLDLNVMDTPRNTTLLSTTQLETLNIQDPRAFSYLTASSYTDSAFGTPNIPRIRGQYADVFYNGMRSSFTDNGYGAPPNFDSLENISITKGPASVVDGPGPGVGGEADFITKRPNMLRFTESASASLDTVGNRRLTVDVGGPIIAGQLGFRISYSGEYSDSYFYDHYMHKNAVYAALRWTPNDQYQLDFNTEVIYEKYTENVGLNRVSQSLIDNGLYLRGAPIGELYSALIGSSPIPVGSPGNPYSPVTPILTEVMLGNPIPINTRITIDETPGVESRALKYNAQLIQTYKFNDKLTFENNTFFDLQDSDNSEPYYYADNSNGSFTFENRADLKYNFDFAGTSNEIITGVTFRFAHTNYISDFNAETPSVYDLTTNPKLWVYSNAYQLAFADALPYKSVFGRTQYGVPGRDSTSAGNTGISDLYDTGFFFQQRVTFSQQVSVLYGGRIDVVQDHSHDPLACLAVNGCFSTLPADHTTGIYGLGNGNISVVYRPQSWVSGYVTFDFTQSVNPDGGEGGVNAYGQVSDSSLLRSDSYLYEAGLKFNLLDNKLFAGTAVFDQKHGIPIGNGSTQTSQANIRGVEIELNYQPTRNFWATVSYSYIKTTLNKPAPFYNYPAAPGLFIDGAGIFATFTPGQKFNDPGIPEDVANVLLNYKFDNGIGLRLGAQVTGPIETTTSGQLDVNASDLGGFLPLVPQSIIANGGYYKSPVIPWQYTMNAAVFYQFKQYTLTFSLYNLTNRLNWQSSPAFYGNDFLVRNDPRTFEVRLQAKF
jgi:outer membrane receptor protein involved in Fe transport